MESLNERLLWKGLDIAIHSMEDLKEVWAIAEEIKRRAKIQLHIDTGMFSMGWWWEEVIEKAREIRHFFIFRMDRTSGVIFSPCDEVFFTGKAEVFGRARRTLKESSGRFSLVFL